MTRSRGGSGAIPSATRAPEHRVALARHHFYIIGQRLTKIELRCLRDFFLLLRFVFQATAVCCCQAPCAPPAVPPRAGCQVLPGGPVHGFIKQTAEGLAGILGVFGAGCVWASLFFAIIIIVLVIIIILIQLQLLLLLLLLLIIIIILMKTIIMIIAVIIIIIVVIIIIK